MERTIRCQVSPSGSPDVIYTYWSDLEVTLHKDKSNAPLQTIKLRADEKYDFWEIIQKHYGSEIELPIIRKSERKRY